MTQEEKQLLLTDLSARLPYGVICDCLHDYHTKASAVDAEDLTVYYPYCDEWESVEYCKPYLRPMLSMTEEECIELDKIESTIENIYEVIPNAPYYIEVASSKQIDWLNAHHFDYRGLIPMGLAIAVTEDNNPYKE